eukprot:11059586-Ditylum_brightwellii.AAC.1
MRILMVGLDAAGKTTILYKLKLGEAESSESASGTTTWQTNYAQCVLSPLDREIVQSCFDRDFLLALCRAYDQ